MPSFSVPLTPNYSITALVTPDLSAALKGTDKAAFIDADTVRNIIPIHVIEQVGGAFNNLILLAGIVRELGYRMILPGVIDKAADKTVFRGYAGPNIKPFSHYFDIEVLQKDECLSSNFKFRQVEDHHKISPTVDAVLIVVHESRHRPWFKAAINGILINGKCNSFFQDCQQDVVKCNRFTWPLDIDANYWRVRENATILCVSHLLDQYNTTFEKVLQLFDEHAKNIAILNWMGLGCGGPRVCSPGSINKKLRKGCFDASPDVINLAQMTLASINQSEDVSIKAVSFRTEFLAQRKGSKPCIEGYLENLKNVTKSWHGHWLRFIDSKKGGTQTISNHMSAYAWLPSRLNSFWNSINVTFTDFPCDGLDSVECAMRDAVILAEAEEVHAWSPGGGFMGNVDILRSRRRKSQAIHILQFNTSIC